MYLKYNIVVGHLTVNLLGTVSLASMKNALDLSGDLGGKVVCKFNRAQWEKEKFHEHTPFDISSYDKTTLSGGKFYSAEYPILALSAPVVH